jgi:raffinose/stachyose/melibiose transport system permease protein
MPLLMAFMAAFKTNQEMTVNPIGLPLNPSLDKIVAAWTAGKFSIYMKNTVIVTTCVTVVSVFLSIMCAYSLALIKPKGHQILFFSILVGLAVPYESYLISLCYDLQPFNLIDTYWALILPQIAMSVCFGTFWLRAFFVAIPGELIEAAVLDGADSWMILWRMLVPLARAAIIAMMVLFIIGTWNEYTLVLVLSTSDAVRTVPVGLALLQNARLADNPLIMSGVLLACLPMLIVYIIFQRQFIEGQTAGAVRG